MSKFAALALATDTPRRMPIRHPSTGDVLKDADGNEAYIELVSLSSKRANKVRAGIQQKRIEARVRKITVEDVEQETLAILSACVTGWHLVGLDGAVIGVPCSEADAQELFATEGMRWLAEQATAFAEAAGNFLPPSLTN